LIQLLKEVKDRADEMGWTKLILNIVTTNEHRIVYEEDFMGNYGTITLDDVLSSERMYIFEQTRKAQDTYMLYKCLMASLTKEAKKKILIWLDQNTVAAKKSTGVALLKVIVRGSHLDTNATTNQMHTALSSLDQYIATVDSNIGMLNQHVKGLIQSLNAQKQTTSDLLINLFKRYGACSNETFLAWLTRKQDDHAEGE
jgi:phosphotransferase system HPr-like phosphotransfer protein